MVGLPPLLAALAVIEKASGCDRVQEPIENFPGVETDFLKSSDAWNPADFGEVMHKADADGQLNLLEWDIDEPPDPDDFECIDAFRDAIALWDAQYFEPSEVMEFSLAIESSDTLEFSILVFADRTNSNDEPPITDFGVRRPKPKLPSFPPMYCAESRCLCGAMPAAQCDGTTATHIYPDRIVFTPCYKNDLAGLVLCDRVGARSPPGGDVFI